MKTDLYNLNLKKAKKPFYNLMMFPYPSAEGLHVGNMYAFTGADVYGRFKRMQGHDVFEPIGLDGFGIHSENYAIKVGRHPKVHAEISEKNFYNQLSKIGNGFAWDYRLQTYSPDFYRWTQWLFIQVFKAGLAYKSEAKVNWCPQDKTVLADEQVEDGKCERCGTQVERKSMSTWFFKITEYAERLLANLPKIDWPEKIKIAQEQWIGKKLGSTISFDIRVIETSQLSLNVQVFTTRLDTIYGVTFLVVAPELAKQWNANGWQASEEVKSYIETSLSKNEEDRKKAAGEKTGVKTDIVAVNPINGKEVPVYIADYVLMEVGTGAVMGVPAHDERDMEFAKKYNLPVVTAVENGKLVDSGEFSGLSSEEAVKGITKSFKEVSEFTHYHLRDWGISRQRYWGPPIPMVHCDQCKWQPVPEDQLPVLLPDIEDFKPKGDGTSPLANAPEEWKKTNCPNCGGEALRELDVSDVFLDSSWYFLAYPNLKTKEWKDGPTPFNAEITSKWLPVDAYIGGAEHAVLHLLYARFIWMVLYDEKLLPEGLGDEPFPFLFGHGLIIKDGAKMSKSKGNVINPDTYIEKFGVDAFRTYLMFLGPYDTGGDFRDAGIEGMKRFITRVEKLYSTENSIKKEDSKVLQSKLHKTIKKVTKDIEVFKYNTALASIMELVNFIKENGSDDDSLKILVQLIAPFAPEASDKIWRDLGKESSVHTSSWPQYQDDLIVEDSVEMAIQINGKLRATITMPIDVAQDESKVEELAMLDENVARYLKGNNVRKRIFVKGKIINFVI